MAYPSKEALRQACEDSLYGSSGEHVAPSTIEKDLWAMRNESELGYYAPIEYSKLHRGYLYSDPDYSINDLSLNEEDMKAIHIAAQTLFQFRNIPVFQQYEHAIEKIIDRLRISPNQEESQSVIQFESSPENKGNQWLSPIFEAIKERKSINISYEKFDTPQAKTYMLHPYLLKEYRNRWYLIAFNPEREIIQTFGLERIKSLKQTKDSFERLKKFDPDVFFKHSIGITQIEETPVKVQISVSAVQGKYLQSQPLHPSQRIISTSENEMLLEYYVLETYELVSYILGLGPSAIVIQPESLKNQVRNALEQTLAQY